MRVPVVIPALEAIYGKKFLEHINIAFMGKTIEEGFEILKKDAAALNPPIEVKFTPTALYGPLKGLGFTFKKKGKKGMKRGSPIFDKFLSKLGGLEAAKEFLSALVLADTTLMDAVAKINEKTGEEFSYANVYAFSQKLNMDFKKGERKGNPSLGKNRPSPVLDSFLSNFKDEAEAKAYLESLTHLSINEALEEINKKINKEITSANLYSFANKWEIEFKRLKAKKGEGKNTKPLVGEVVMDSAGEEVAEISPKNLVKVQYKCSCGHAKGMQKHGLEIPLGLRGMRCPACNNWGTYVATVIDGDSIRRFAIVEEEGVLPSVKMQAEVEVDANMNPILREDIKTEDLQPA